MTLPLFVAFLGFQYYVHQNIGLVAIGHFRLIGWHTPRLFILGLFQLLIPLPNYLIRRLFLDWGIERNELIAYFKIIGPLVVMGLVIGLIFIRNRIQRKNFRLSRIEKTGLVWAAASLLPFCFFPQELFPASRYLFIPAMGWSVFACFDFSLSFRSNETTPKMDWNFGLMADASYFFNLADGV